MIRVSVWTAVFLIALRLAIGWHFAYEGYGKVKSAYLGKAAVNEKPFSSETYFRESEGPFGRLVKAQLPDPDQVVIAKVTPRPVEGDPSQADPKSRFPAALEAEWDDYLRRFQEQYRLDDAQQAEAQKIVDQAKADYVTWVGVVRTREQKEQAGRDERLGIKPAPQPKWALLTVKRKAPGVNNSSADFDDEVTVAERAAELRAKSAEVRAAYAKLQLMGKDVAGANLRADKAEVKAIRTELQKEIDEQTQAMKDALARLLDTRVTAYAAQVENKGPAETVQAMLTPMTAADSANPLAKMWDAYARYVKDFAPGIDDGKKAEIDREVAEAKVRFDRWLADRDGYTDAPVAEKPVETWRKNYAAADARRKALDRVLPAPKKAGDQAPPQTVTIWLPPYMVGHLAAEKVDAEIEAKALVSQMQNELKTRSNALRTQVGTPVLGAARAKGYATDNSGERTLLVFPKNWTLIDYLDWSTRWFLLVVGVLLMVGLFTRFSCFAAAGFLLLTILTQPSLPWIPAPPTSEGNYLVVNKNVIEMFALLALMTTRSGRWFGLDAVASWALGRRRNTET